MPHFFNQPNNSDEESVDRNNAEIYAITQYFYPDGDKKTNDNSNKYIGDAENGEKLFNSVGCRGCHVVEEETTLLSDIDVEYEMYLSKYGYEPDTSGTGYEKMDRYTLLKYQGPNLIGLGSKTDAKWIYNWIKNPEDYKLPVSEKINDYVIAKNNNYFIYPNNQNKFINLYQNSFQHGGISMDEMIVPFASLKSKK